MEFRITQPSHGSQLNVLRQHANILAFTHHLFQSSGAMLEMLFRIVELRCGESR